MEARKQCILGFLCVTVFIIYLPESFLQPFFPVYGTEVLGFSSLQVSAIFATPPLFASFGTPLAGFLCVKLNRVPTWFFGQILMCISLMSFAICKNFWTMVLWRAFQGLSISLVKVSTQSIITGLFFDDGKATAMGYYCACLSGAFAVGPLVGGILFQLVGFFYMFLIQGLVTVLPIFFIPFVKAANQNPAYQRLSQQSETHQSFTINQDILIASFAWLMMFFQYGGVQTTLQGKLTPLYGISTTVVGIILCSNNVLQTLILPIVGRKVDQKEIERKSCLILGFGICIVYHLMLTMNFTGYSMTIFVSMCAVLLQGAAAGIMLPAIYSALADSVSQSGGSEEHTSMIMTLMEGIGFFCASMLSGWCLIGMPKSELHGPDNTDLKTAFPGTMLIFAIIYTGVTAIITLFANGKYKEETVLHHEEEL